MKPGDPIIVPVVVRVGSYLYPLLVETKVPYQKWEEPEYPRQRLTFKLVRELLKKPLPLNHLVVWANQHPGEFFVFMAKHYPEWMTHLTREMVEKFGWPKR